MDKFRIELGSSSESLQSSVQDELDDIDKQISDMQDAGLARSKQYREIKRKRIEKRREYLALTQQSAEERFRETKSSEIENVSELLGVSTSEAEPYYEGAKARELARFGR
jgi:vacuolar-type H+-ATPase subunit I/STV1